jgi:hypothetical protein
VPRKRRSLLGSPDGQVSSEAASPAPPPVQEVRERTTPGTEAIQRRTDGGAPQRPTTPAPSELASTPAPTPPTRDRVSGDWFLASGQSPPERTMSGSEPALTAPPARNPWLMAAPIAGIAAVGLLFVIGLVAALALL